MAGCRNADHQSAAGGDLGRRAIVKRPMVQTSDDGDDYHLDPVDGYFALTFDHRIIDGSDAEKFSAI